MSDVQLILVVTATYTGAIGFAEVFDCQIRKVIDGSLKEDAIKLTILPSDKDMLDALFAHAPPHEIEIGFVMADRNVPYGVAPISGFVDGARTSWRVTYLREASARGKS